VLFSRSGLPARLTRPAYVHGAAVWAAVLTTVIGALAGVWLAFALGVAALVAACASDRALYHAGGGEPLPRRFAWVTIALALVGPFVAASMWFDHHVDWRGHDYALDDKARLEVGR
jgi:hypothetical protein